MSKVKILFEKLRGEEILNGWTRVFNNEDELLKFMIDNKTCILGEPLSNKYYNIRIRTFGGNDEK